MYDSKTSHFFGNLLSIIYPLLRRFFGFNFKQAGVHGCSKAIGNLLYTVLSIAIMSKKLSEECIPYAFSDILSF